MSVIIVGFAIGLVGQKMWQQNPTRVDRIYSLFAEVCLPQHRGAQLPALDALGLVSYVPKDGNLLWIAPCPKPF
ncbi:hypothetical protein NBRC116590_19520 [Pelagimonas sp. KU-00592-HH]|uniref:hypothetical protein n=1 Tax=Pelagimonas sp. KU-00592-HH TaxID=3127651 RepID=UPI003103C2AC